MARGLGILSIRAPSTAQTEEDSTNDFKEQKIIIFSFKNQSLDFS